MNWAPKFGRLLRTAIGFVVTLLMVGNCLAQTTRRDRERERESDELEITQRSWNLRMLSIMVAQKRPHKFNSEPAISPSNPFFKETGVVGADAFQARRDLEAIIELSSSVRELSRRLSESDTTEQTPQDPGREEKMALAALRRQEIPEATLQCSPDELKWWEEIRAVGYKVKKSREKDGDKFLQLLKEGHENSYQVPIPNRGPTFLRKFPPEYTEEARRINLSGGIAMVVEFLQDGMVGEVKIVQGLGFGLDEKAAEAARRSIFLPAVKDARFVSVRVPMTISFSIDR